MPNSKILELVDIRICFCIDQSILLQRKPVTSQLQHTTGRVGYNGPLKSPMVTFYFKKTLTFYIRDVL